MSHDAADWIPLFPKEEVPYILAAVIRTAARLKKLHGIELENDITDRLRDLLDRDPGLRARPVELFREVPLYDRRRARQKQLGRTDLMFLYSTGTRKPWPYFVIESKRLHVTFPSGWASLVSEYVGHQGMMCFIEERYARGLASGGMLGYVFDGQVKTACDTVRDAIETNKDQLKCCVAPPFAPSSILSGTSEISESTHSLSQNVFVIYHLLLPV